MKKTFTLLAILCLAANAANADTPVNIGKQQPKIENRRLSPEVLWAMGRIGGYEASPDGRRIVYNVAYYSVAENKGHHVLYVMNSDGSGQQLLTTSDKNETDAAWMDNETIAFLTGGQLWTMKADGTSRRQLTHDAIDIEGFKFSPDRRQVILIKSLPYHGTIEERPADLPKATGRLVTDMNYRHWDHYVESICHPFVAAVTEEGIGEGKDLLDGEPYECPTAPFGGIEQLDWSADSKCVAYTCRKKEGVEYAISTDTDIFLYDTTKGTTTNLCKSGQPLPKSDATKSMANQPINRKQYKNENVGYDTNPQFSPDGRHIAWLSMERDGYESDRNRLCCYDLQSGTKKYLTESFDSNVDDFCWSSDSKTLYFIGVWHATENLYRTDLSESVVRLTDCQADFGSLKMLNDGQRIVAERHDFFSPADLYLITPGKDAKRTKIQQITKENKHIFDGLDKGTVEKRWVTTTDGKQMLYWVVLPPNFDPNKKYPTLLFCEGGPQSPVSQFWSYRWNFMIMAAQGYVVVAPNRHGLPGFGSEWCEQISGDWTGQCMQDYLTAIDDAAQNLPYVDANRLAAVGASFGGFSVYYLAGHHQGRFKCFISHDGAFNLESMYTDTEEVWFSNWEYDDAYWNKDQTDNARKTYANSPHRSVDQWDTPILCIHGELDYRINANQGMGAFNAARLRGIPAQLLIFPDENHWVLKPQNGILWQRTYFNWLDRWLK